MIYIDTYEGQTIQNVITIHDPRSPVATSALFRYNCLVKTYCYRIQALRCTTPPLTQPPFSYFCTGKYVLPLWLKEWPEGGPQKNKDPGLDDANS